MLASDEIDYENVCRTCLTNKENMKSLYDVYSSELCVVDVFISITALKFCGDVDGLPTQICQNCFHELNLTYKFVLKSRKSEQKLQDHLDNIINKRDKNAVTDNTERSPSITKNGSIQSTIENNIHSPNEMQNRQYICSEFNVKSEIGNDLISNDLMFSEVDVYSENRIKLEDNGRNENLKSLRVESTNDEMQTDLDQNFHFIKQEINNETDITSNTNDITISRTPVNEQDLDNIIKVRDKNVVTDSTGENSYITKNDNIQPTIDNNIHSPNEMQNRQYICSELNVKSEIGNDLMFSEVDVYSENRIKLEGNGRNENLISLRVDSTNDDMQTDLDQELYFIKQEIDNETDITSNTNDITISRTPVNEQDPDNIIKIRDKNAVTDSTGGNSNITKNNIIQPTIENNIHSPNEMQSRQYICSEINVKSEIGNDLISNELMFSEVDVYSENRIKLEGNGRNENLKSFRVESTNNEMPTDLDQELHFIKQEIDNETDITSNTNDITISRTPVNEQDLDIIIKIRDKNAVTDSTGRNSNITNNNIIQPTIENNIHSPNEMQSCQYICSELDVKSEIGNDLISNDLMFSEIDVYSENRIKLEDNENMKEIHFIKFEINKETDILDTTNEITISRTPVNDEETAKFPLYDQKSTIRQLLLQLEQTTNITDVNIEMDNDSVISAELQNSSIINNIKAETSNDVKDPLKPMSESYQADKYLNITHPVVVLDKLNMNFATANCQTYLHEQRNDVAPTEIDEISIANIDATATRKRKIFKRYQEYKNEGKKNKKLKENVLPSTSRETLTKQTKLLEQGQTHTEKKPYSSTVCAALCHKRTHTKPYSCAKCNKSCRIKTSLINDRKHKGEKPYSCTVSDKPVKHKSNVAQHENSHMEKPYSCALCNKSFGLKTSLTMHMLDDDSDIYQLSHGGALYSDSYDYLSYTTAFE